MVTFSGGTSDMPPLALLPAELEAIVLGAQWVAAHGEKELSRAALDVLTKVTAVVPPRTCSRLSAFQARRQSCVSMHHKGKMTEQAFERPFVQE